MMKTAFIAAAALATLAGGTAASAKNVAVTYKDLDLSTEAGQAKLAQRLDAAARDACDVADVNTGTRMKSRAATDCYKQARQNSEASMAAIIKQARLGG